MLDARSSGEVDERFARARDRARRPWAARAEASKIDWSVTHRWLCILVASRVVLHAGDEREDATSNRDGHGPCGYPYPTTNGLPTHGLP